jgi:hypothetical protein
VPPWAKTGEEKQRATKPTNSPKYIFLMKASLIKKIWKRTH